MALQELSFVTLGQRVLANPLRIRQHYGHPDFFDKMFVMTEGGMSKASKGINLSEDVFAGFNATIRGHTVSFKEYAQVGKGRDVGLQQTYKFEAKLSQGNAEQSLSRDLYRICDRLDFFRLCSFFWGGIGHYISNAMVMFTLVLVVYTMLALAIYGEEGVNGRPMHPEGVLQLLLSGLGLLQTLPLFITLTVEKGIISAVSEISFMFLSGGPLYFIFHIQTKSYYFQQTLLAGGAMYRPTGRGFVIRHSPFDENFRFFVSSHIYLGIELMVALILFFVYTTSKQYGGLTWSLWLTVASFLMGPFWFNPVTFEINKVKEDYILWMNWMTETGGTGEQSWECWWKEENSFYGGLSLSWKIFLFVQKSCIWLFISYGLAGSRLRRDSGEQLRVLQLFLLFGVFVFGHWCIAKVEKSLVYAIRRFCTLCLSTVVSVTTIYLFISHPLYIKFSIAIYYLFSAVSFFLLLCGFKQIQWAYKFHDYAVGHVLMFILLILSGLQIAYLQTWLLYHNALSAGVVIDDILKYARKNKEQHISEVNQMSDLRTQVAEQDRIIKGLLQGKIEMSEKSNINIKDAVGKGYGSTGVTISISDQASKAAVVNATAAPVKMTTTAIPAQQQKHQTSVALSPITPSSILTNKKAIDYDLAPSSNSTNTNSNTDANSKTNQTAVPVTEKKKSSSRQSSEFIFQQPTQFPSRE
jgi:callose synthase